jgi:hypothetical protein
MKKSTKSSPKKTELKPEVKSNKKIYPPGSIQGILKQITKDAEIIADNNFSEYPIEKLIDWRNSASHRIDAYDLAIKAICNDIASLVGRLNKTKKRRESDAMWIRKLHKILHKRIFKSRQ